MRNVMLLMLLLLPAGCPRPRHGPVNMISQPSYGQKRAFQEVLQGLKLGMSPAEVRGQAVTLGLRIYRARSGQLKLMGNSVPTERIFARRKGRFVGLRKFRAYFFNHRLMSLKLYFRKSGRSGHMRWRRALGPPLLKNKRRTIWQKGMIYLKANNRGTRLQAVDFGALMAASKIPRKFLKAPMKRLLRNSWQVRIERFLK